MSTANLVRMGLALIVFLVGIGVLNSCSRSEPRVPAEAKVQANSSTTASGSWVSEEVLLQLKEVRAELAAVKQSLATLNEQVAKLQGARGVVNLGPPKAPANLEVIDLPAMGSRKAGVGIVEFSDFECPYCARHDRLVFPDIKKQFLDTGKARYFSLQYPLSFHSSAKGAAVAALCADRQGRYWSMRSALFAQHSSLDVTLYRSLASSLGMDSKKFDACLTDDQVIGRVDTDIGIGDAAGVSGTPRFLIGRLDGSKLTEISVLEGAQPFQQFALLVNQKLTKQ